MGKESNEVAKFRAMLDPIDENPAYLDTVVAEYARVVAERDALLALTENGMEDMEQVVGRMRRAWAELKF